MHHRGLVPAKDRPAVLPGAHLRCLLGVVLELFHGSLEFLLLLLLVEVVAAALTVRRLRDVVVSALVAGAYAGPGLGRRGNVDRLERGVRFLLVILVGGSHD